MDNTSNLDWKTIPEFPDYSITPDGQVWSFKSNKFLKPWLNNQGYSLVRLHNDLGKSNHRVHRLVGTAFVPLPEEFNNNYDIATINHIDHDKKNNHYNNLEWVTREYNGQEPWINGYCDNIKEPCFCIDMYAHSYGEYKSVVDLSNAINNSPSGVYNNIITHKSNSPLHGRYIVGYLNDQKWIELFKHNSVDDIIDMYIPQARSNGPKIVTDMLTNETVQYNTYTEIEDALHAGRNTLRYHIDNKQGIYKGRYKIEYLIDVMNSYYYNCQCF